MDGIESWMYTSSSLQNLEEALTEGRVYFEYDFA